MPYAHATVIYPLTTKSRSDVIVATHVLTAFARRLPARTLPDRSPRKDGSAYSSPKSSEIQVIYEVLVGPYD